MKARAAAVRFSVLFGLACLLAASRAQAQAPACDVDKDCPGNAACGGDDCVKSSGGALCTPPDPIISGFSDGFCRADDDCKCKSLGATCVGFYCSYTVPPTGTGTGGSGTGSAGTSGGGGGGCSAAGVPSFGQAGLALLGAAVGVGVGVGLMRRRSRRRA